jgi:hypothetical protein
MIKIDGVEWDCRMMQQVWWSGQGANNFYVNNSTFIGGNEKGGSVLFIDKSSQMFITNCKLRMTDDCGAAIYTRGNHEIAFTGNDIRDRDNTTTDGSGWGKGRVWSANGSGGSEYHLYFGENLGYGLGTRGTGTNLPDPNSGEIFLWEANGTLFSGSVSAATASTVSFGSSVPNPSRVLSIAIIKGKGVGQFRRIIVNNGSTLSVDKAWEVVPDGSSVAIVGPYVQKITFYKNQLDGTGKNLTGSFGTASAGIEAFGGCFDFVADGNTMKELRKGISTWGTTHDVSIEPSYFCLYTNNKMIDCMAGIHQAAFENSLGVPSVLGITYRNNVVQNSTRSSIYNELLQSNLPVLSTMVYEHNIFSGGAGGFKTGRLRNPDPRVDYGSGAMENPFLYKNSFSS